MKVHKLEILIVDHDDLGIDKIQSVIENQRYPNWCISPRVMRSTTKEIDYSDEHPLNTPVSARAEYEKLFK